MSDSRIDQKKELAYPPSNTVLSFVALKIFERFLIILPKLPNNILAYIAVVLLHPAGEPQLVFWRYGRHLSTLPHQVQHELRDIASCDWDVFDRAPDDVPLSTWNNVSNTISRIDNRSGERAVCNSVRGPRRGERKDSLDGDVQSLDVKRLEEYLSRLFSVFGWIERWFSLIQLRGTLGG